MAKVLTIYNNFARGQIDHDMLARFDLPVYNSSADKMQNFFTNFKGNAIYRYGFEDMIGAFQDCYMHEFKFRDDQNYTMVFYNTKLRFLSYDINGVFGWVTSGGSPIEVTTPYTLAESKELQFTQNFDAVVITHQNHPPKDLTRLSANSFTLTDHVFSGSGGSPFASSIKNVSAVTKANPAVVTTSADHFFRTGQAVTFASVGGMTELNGNTYIIKKISNTTFELQGIDSTSYGTYTSGGTATRGVDYPKTGLFYKGSLYFSNTPRRPTTILKSETGDFSLFDIPSSVVDTSPLDFTLSDIAQPIEALFGGDNSLIALSRDGVVAINGGDVGSAITAENIEATLTSADGANSTIPFSKDGYIFYVGKNSRNMYYFNYDLLTESFKAKDANFVSYDITASGLGKIRHKKDRDDLIFAIKNNGSILSLNFNEEEKIIGWHEHKTNGLFKDIVVMNDNNGNPQLFALVLRGSSYYIERMSSYIEFSKRVDFFTDDKKADDDAYIRKVAEELNECIFVDNALKYSNLQSGNTITYDSVAGTVTDTDGVFVSGDVGKHISYKTETGYESGRFEITAVNTANEVDVVVLQTPTQNTYDNWYLSFSSLSGLSQYNGTTVSIVTDGGFFKDELVSGGVINFDTEVLSVVIGYKYKGIIKSFCLGFSNGAENTQTTMKAINRFGLRTVNTAGLKAGSTLYRLENAQQLSQNDLNYLPPLPIDGTKYINYSDENEQDKYFYIVQDDPLPATIGCVMVDANYSITR